MNQPYWIKKNGVYGLLLFPFLFWAQSKSNTVDQFHDLFFEALQHKGIENYDQSIVALDKCLEVSPENDVVYYEKGRNYFFLKKYNLSIQAYQKSLQLNPKNQWTIKGLYDVYYATKDFEKAIPLLQQLILSTPRYQEDLVALYMFTKQYDNALGLIQKLEQQVGITAQREAYKKQLFADPKYQNIEIQSLEKAIKKYPKEEANYISLIYLYTQAKQDQKVTALLQQLQQHIPYSKWSQLGLFSLYLKDNKIDEAVEAIKQTIQQQNIPVATKLKMIEELLNNTNSISDLDQKLKNAIAFSSDKTTKMQLNQFAGQWHQNKNQDTRAILFFKEAIQDAPNDLRSQMLMLQSYYKLRDFIVLQKEATALVDVFPLQPDLYYLSGLANNQLQNYSKAKQYLEEGLDLVVDNKGLQLNFHLQLMECCQALKDEKCFKTHQNYVQKLKTTQQ